jgi:hypothetical protein
MRVEYAPEIANDKTGVEIGTQGKRRSFGVWIQRRGIEQCFGLTITAFQVFGSRMKPAVQLGICSSRQLCNDLRTRCFKRTWGNTIRHSPLIVFNSPMTRHPDGLPCSVPTSLSPVPLPVPLLLIATGRNDAPLLHVPARAAPLLDHQSGILAPVGLVRGWHIHA